MERTAQAESMDRHANGVGEPFVRLPTGKELRRQLGPVSKDPSDCGPDRICGAVLTYDHGYGCKRDESPHCLHAHVALVPSNEGIPEAFQSRRQRCRVQGSKPVDEKRCVGVVEVELDERPGGFASLQTVLGRLYNELRSVGNMGAIPAMKDAHTSPPICLVKCMVPSFSSPAARDTTRAARQDVVSTV